MKEPSKAETRYQELFPDEKVKAMAFDQIAAKYYFKNFGTISKTDFEVLLFSIYLDRILEKDDTEYTAYSDYTLSKFLGITQARISGLKIKKDLQYPHKYKWRESLARISSRAIYEDGRVKLQIPDRNLFLEIKNAIEETGGYIEIQLTPNLLQVKLSYFLDLLVAISDEHDRMSIREEIKKKIEDKNDDIKFMEKESFGKKLKNQLPTMVVELIGSCIPVVGGAVQVIAENVYKAIKDDK